MASTDPWTGLIDPRAALAAARRTLAGPSSNFSSGAKYVSSTFSEICPELSQISSFSRPGGALKQDSGNSTKNRKETCSSSLSETYAVTQPPPGLPASDSECAGDTPSAKAANPLKYASTHSDCSEIALAAPAKAFLVTNTVPSPTAHLSGPAEWRDGLARLDLSGPPCPGFRGREWADLHRVIAHFMDHYAAEAFARGWDAPSLFGVHRDAGAARVDACGALMLPWRRNVSSLTAEEITFGPLVYRRRALPEAVPAWDYAGGGWREEAI